MNLDSVRKLIRTLPGTEEGRSYGTPAWKAGRKLIARVLEDGETLVVKVDMDDRELLVEASPDVYSITPHYQNYPYVVIALARVDRDELFDLLLAAWRDVAPRKWIAVYESESR